MNKTPPTDVNAVGADRWLRETMLAINKLMPEIQGQHDDPGWFLLRQRLEEVSL